MLTQAFALSAAGREAEAVALIEQLAAQRHPEALFLLGDIYWRGQLAPKDMVRGRDFFRQASDAGHPAALRAYTNLLGNGAAGPRDWSACIARLRAEARIDTRRAHMLALIEAMDLDANGDPKGGFAGRQISDSPQVALFPGLFTPAECEFLMLVAEPTYLPSMIVSSEGDRRDPVRTSDGAPMHLLVEDPVIHALNRRLAAVSGTNYDQGEPLLILRYRPGQQYRKHYDAIPGVTNQRHLTALVYLNQGYGGGETEFTKTGLKVKGRPGDAIVFRNSLLGGRYDPMAEHAGLPVTSGVKHLASRWIRQAPYAPED